MIIFIRQEEEKDYRRVEEVTRQAFSYPGRIENGKIGCPYEHWMVNELRRRDGILSLSLVAEVEQQVVGHIICSKAVVRKEEITLPVLNFGPLSVLPEYQRKGVGKALINGMLEKAKAEGHGAILFFGGRSIIRSLDLRKLLCMGFRIVRDIIFPLLWQWS